MRLLSLLFLLAVGCSSEVTVDGESGASSGAGGADTTSSSATGTSGCEGNGFPCAAGCGGDYFPAEAECKNGAWVCPPGTIDPATCPASTCWGLPFSCEICDGGWQCAPTPACAAGCPGVVCLECPDEPVAIEGCDCACDANGQFSCVPKPQVCCDHDVDCGDESYVPCVNNVCKQPVPDKCWSTNECPLGMACYGASVCPCGADCDQPDTPGFCMGGPP